MIKGLYIEDDNDNIESYSARFKTQNIELVSVDDFPVAPKDFWGIVLKEDVDFIIIDNHLHKKKVQYKGLDVLTEIRKMDSEIYIIFLTSKGFSPEDDYLSDFDQEIAKEDFARDFFKIVERIKRATSRDLGIKLEREIDDANKAQKKYFEERLVELKKILGN